MKTEVDMTCELRLWQKKSLAQLTETENECNNYRYCMQIFEIIEEGR